VTQLMSPDPQPRRPGDSRLSVVVVNDFATITGGSDRVALAEAVGLARRGHRVTLIAGHGEPDPQLLDAGVEVLRTGQQTTLSDPNRLRAAAQGVWNRRAAVLVRDALAQADRSNTVVHLHGFIKVLSPSVVRAAIRSGLPTVATLHDYSVACPNGGLFNYQTNQICPLEPMSARCIATHCDARAYSHKLWRVGRQAVQRRFGAMPAGVGQLIAPSRSAAEIIEPFLPGGLPVTILSNPVSVSRMEPVDAARNEPFVMLGRLQHDKGGVLLALAARAAGVRAVFVGQGADAGPIQRANPDAELTGWLDPEQVRAMVRGARAVVNASLIYETQGLTLLEAAAEGVPAIVSNSSVAREAVEDHGTGLWFKAGDADDLAEKLIALHRDPDLAARLGKAAYERFWSQPPDLPSHLDRLERIYRDAVRQ
jgi:glycosyltransferase involved in cell wall biosynthesis